MTNMDNKNTIPYKTNIIKEKNQIFTPGVGDELIFCLDEDVALASYNNYVENQRDPEYEPIEEQYLTDFFKIKEVKGTMCEPMYIGEKKFGFFGCRMRLSNKLREGRFYLYEME